MIEGVVNQSSQAIVVIEVCGPGGQSRQNPSVIDTGFTGDLTLSRAAIRSLGLTSAGTRTGELADGRVVVFTMYKAQVKWHAGLLDVGILQSDSDSLLGMGLLSGSRLTIDMITSGKVTIKPLPRKAK